jgi:type 1 glutamine amidotransferase
MARQVGAPFMAPASFLSRILAAVIVAALALAIYAPAQEASPAKTVLVISTTKGFRHTTCSYGKPVITKIGEQSGAFKTICSEDPKVINDDFLAGIDCVVFNSSTGSFLNDDQKVALLKYVREGGGVVGIHAATDSHYDWPGYADLIGGWFDGHPWNEQVTIRIEVPDHPVCEPVDNPWVIVDEIYQHREWSRDEVCVLMSLDPNGTDFTKQGMKRQDGDYGICWCKQYGKGRSLYTALGHRNEVFDNPMFQKHLLNSILWAMGDLEGTSEPHPKPG